VFDDPKVSTSGDAPEGVDPQVLPELTDADSLEVLESRPRT
jgi:hypothetical protein